jgi:hypothetical protein
LLLAFLCTIWSWMWGYEQLHALLPSTFLDFYWFLVDELMFIGNATKVPPWLSFSSSGMAESYSSLFVSDTPVVLMVKEGTSLVLVWKLHLQWLKGVFWCPWLFTIPRDTVGRPPLMSIDTRMHAMR